MATLHRFLCVLTKGHAWTHFYTREYSGREVMVSTCTRCRHTRKDTV